MQDISPPTWIPVTQAWKLVSSSSDRVALLHDLDDVIARGGIRVWATGITSLHRDGGSSRQPSGPVQPAIWAKLRETEHDAALWATGVATINPSDKETGVVLRGVRLERAPFLRLIGDYLSVAPAAHVANPDSTEGTDKRAPGGQRDWKNWERVWVAVLDIALEERLNRIEFPSVAKFIEAIRENAGDDIFSDKTIKPYISRVYKRFVQPPD